MTKTLTDQELRIQFQTLSRGQLENYLLQVVRKLEQYQSEESTEEEKNLLEKLKAERSALEKRLIILTKETKIAKQNYIDLSKNYNLLEQEKVTLLKENKILKSEQKAATKTYNKLKTEQATTEQEQDKMQEELLASNRQANDWKTKLHQEREIRKKDKQKIIELESYNEELINQILSLQAKYEQEKAQVIRIKQKQKQVEINLFNLAYQHQTLQDNYQQIEQAKNVAGQQLLSERAKNENLEQIIGEKTEEVQNLESKVSNYDNLVRENEQNKKAIARLKKQTASPSVISKLEQEKKQLVQQLKLERDERQKLEQEQAQNKLASAADAEKITILQQRITENISFINNLHENLRQNDADWQLKVSQVNNNLEQTQEQLKSLLSQHAANQEELQTRTQERDKSQQMSQTLKDNLEISQLKEEKLNEQIIKLHNELAIVHKKLEEVVTERNNNQKTIFDHHQEKIYQLEKEKKELTKKHRQLTIRYEETSQQLAKLNDELNKNQTLSSSLEQNFLAACEKLKEERDKNHKLEQKLRERTENFATQISNLKKGNATEKQQLVQQITRISNEKLTNEQQLIRRITELKNRIKDLENTSQTEKKNLEIALHNLQNVLQAKITTENNYQKQIQILNSTISNLKQQMENLTDDAQREKSKLASKIAGLEEKLTIISSTEVNYQKAITGLKKRLKNSVSKLTIMTNSWKEIAEERDDLLLAIKDLENQISKLTKISFQEKKQFAKQILNLKTELAKKDQAETNYQTKIKELEENLLSLIDKLKVNVQNQQIKKKTEVNELKKEIQVKEQNLASLHEELIDLQNRLNIANDVINQQTQKISQKNQQLTELTDQLAAKDKLIVDLQIEIANLKNPPTFVTNNISKITTTNHSSEQLINKKNEVSENFATTYSQEDLERLIKEHQQEVEKLKSLLIDKSQELNLVQETPATSTIQQVPKKNNGALWLCLLGYSLSTILLCFNLLKKLKKKKLQKQ